MSPTMVSENPKPPIPSEIATPIPTNPQNPRQSRPRVREVSSRFMSPVTKSPSIVNSKQIIPSTPSESHLTKTHYLRRSSTDVRPRYADENRPDSLNRSSVSPVRTTSKPRAAVKLYKDGSRADTPVSGSVGPRVLHHRSFDTAALKLLHSNGMICSSYEDGNDTNRDKDKDKDRDDSSSDCNSVRSNEVFVRSGKVARSLNLPPMPPEMGCSRPPQGTGVEARKAVVRKLGLDKQNDAHRLKLLQNYYLQWRFANARNQACLSKQKKQSEKMLYSLGVKISEFRDYVKSKRVEFGLLKEAKALSTILDEQMPCLDEWSALEEAYSSSLLELTQGLQNISSRLPLMGNVKVDIKQINEAMNSAMRVADLICSQVQNFMPKAEEMDGLVSDLTRVHSGEVTLVQECGDLLSKTHLSQIEECSLRGQLMQFQKCNHNGSKEGQT